MAHMFTKYQLRSWQYIVAIIESLESRGYTACECRVEHIPRIFRSLNLIYLEI